eukprot:4779509-Amphidinium_carterae.2
MQVRQQGYQGKGNIHQQMLRNNEARTHTYLRVFRGPLAQQSWGLIQTCDLGCCMEPCSCSAWEASVGASRMCAGRMSLALSASPGSVNKTSHWPPHLRQLSCCTHVPALRVARRQLRAPKPYIWQEGPVYTAQRWQKLHDNSEPRQPCASTCLGSAKCIIIFVVPPHRLHTKQIDRSPWSVQGCSLFVGPCSALCCACARARWGSTACLLFTPAVLDDQHQLLVFLFNAYEQPHEAQK